MIVSRLNLNDAGLGLFLGSLERAILIHVWEHYGTQWFSTQKLVKEIDAPIRDHMTWQTTITRLRGKNILTRRGKGVAQSPYEYRVLFTEDEFINECTSIVLGKLTEAGYI